MIQAVQTCELPVRLDCHAAKLGQALVFLHVADVLTIIIAIHLACIWCITKDGGQWLAALTEENCLNNPSAAKLNLPEYLPLKESL